MIGNDWESCITSTLVCGASDICICKYLQVYIRVAYDVCICMCKYLYVFASVLVWHCGTSGADPKAKYLYNRPSQ